MKNQNGKTPLELLLTVTILLIVAGVVVAMIFGNTDVVSNIKGLVQRNDAQQTQNDDTNIIHTDEKISDLTTGIYK